MVPVAVAVGARVAVGGGETVTVLAGVAVSAGIAVRVGVSVGHCNGGKDVGNGVHVSVGVGVLNRGVAACVTACVGAGPGVPAFRQPSTTSTTINVGTHVLVRNLTALDDPLISTSLPSAAYAPSRALSASVLMIPQVELPNNPGSSLWVVGKIYHNRSVYLADGQL
jgi:hypothetical protein